MSEKAGELAAKLVEIFNQYKLPRAAALNRKYAEGFTGEKMRGNPESLFQMIMLASYDRRPFTIASKGWEPIWGLSDSGPSLPAILRAAQLYHVTEVLALSLPEIESRLTSCRFFKYRLDFDGANTRYCRTFRDAGELVGNRGLLSQLESARTAPEVKSIHKLFDSIHGIGPTIASKLVMYTLREVAVGDIDPRELYPAVMPLLNEYHNARLASELRERYGPNIVDEVFEALKELGDPFAIDALYYVDRAEPGLRESLFQGTQP